MTDDQKKPKLITRRRLIVIIILIVLAIGLRFKFGQSNQVGLQNKVLNQITNDNRTTLQPAKSTVAINREFNFPIRDDKGEEVGKIKYLIDSAEKRNEILIKGQKATALAGRTFLIINIKVENKSNQKIQINTRDYVRLSVNDNAEWLAPDIHNDPVEVQAISTKHTRIGFPVSDSDKNLKLQVGEIKGEKATIDLNLP